MSHHWQLADKPVPGWYGGIQGKVFRAKCLICGENTAFPAPMPRAEHWKRAKAPVLPECRHNGVQAAVEMPASQAATSVAAIEALGPSHTHSEETQEDKQMQKPIRTFTSEETVAILADYETLGHVGTVKKNQMSSSTLSRMLARAHVVPHTERRRAQAAVDGNGKGEPDENAMAAQESHRMVTHRYLLEQAEVHEAKARTLRATARLVEVKLSA